MAGWVGKFQGFKFGWGNHFKGVRGADLCRPAACWLFGVFHTSEDAHGAAGSLLMTNITVTVQYASSMQL